MSARSILCVCSLCFAVSVIAQDTTPLFVWPDLAPNETDRATGTTLAMNPADLPPITRIEHIRRPPMTVYPATKNANGAAVLILPGGGFARVVPDLEGSEAAAWLSELGVTSFVLNYRTRREDLPDEQPGNVRYKMHNERCAGFARMLISGI